MIGQLISGASNLISGFMGQNAQENANAANQALQQTQMAYQHQANTNAVQWRVADAIKAGLHPLAALGMSPASGFSASVGRQEPEDALGKSLGNMGQDIARAIQATQTTDEKARAYNNRVAALTLEKGNLQNELIRAQIRKLNQQDQPPLPVKTEPYEAGTTAPGNASAAPSQNPTVDYMQVEPNLWRPSPGKAYKQSIEDNFVRERIADVEQLIAPGFSTAYQHPPAHVPLKPGHQWAWSPFRLGYYQTPIRKSQERFDDRKYYPENNIIRLR